LYLFALCLLAAASLEAAWAAPAAPGRVILVVGDSLSAEYGLPRDSGWVHRLSARLPAGPGEYSVVNASISGDTTEGGRNRLPRLLAQWKPLIVVIELGANDGLRGLDVEQMRANLQAMVDASVAAHAQVLLIGIHIPPNYGRAYTQQFADSFELLARRNRLRLVPFLLEGFADRLDLFQPANIHPTEQAPARMLDNDWPALQTMLKHAERPAS
jgi:acyl-CoA thioesterase-1